MQLSTLGPASDGARAQLLLALLILALFPVTLLARPRETDSLTFDLGLITEELTAGMNADEAGWIRPRMRSRRPSGYFVLDIFVAPPNPSAPRHRLDLLPTGELLFDSRRVTLQGLRSRLDLLLATPGWVDFHPHPEARYEDVVATLAPVAYSGFDRFRFDNGRYAEAFEAATAEDKGPGRSGAPRAGGKAALRP